MAEPMRVMFLAANPFLDLKINDEVRDIRARIRESVFRNADLDYEPATRASDLIGRLDESKPHVVHFSGHGTEAHDLILLDDQGAPTPVDRDLLAELFRLCRDNLRVVFLNFCHSLPIAEEIRDVVPCVIGTIDAIPDQAARFFAAQFYGSLSSGRTVREAFDRATLQLKLQKIPGGETLRLLHADDVDPNALRLVEPVSAPDADPASDEPRSRSDEPGHSARRGLGAPGRLSRPAGESGAVWRWVETNWDQLTVVLVALALAALTVAVAGRTALGFAIVGVVAVAAGAWLAYRIAARRREARALLDVAKRNVVDRPGFFRVRPYDDSEEDQQLFDRADGAHEAVLRWLRDPREPLLFLSGLSGTGKSSLLYAYVLPRLRRDPAAGPPARDLVPRHSEQPPPAPRAVVVLRSYDDPIGALTAELRKLDALRRQPPETGDPRDLLRLAAERSGGRLLVVLDQFEGLLIAQESHAPRFEAFVALLKSLGRDPVPGVTVLITLRGDYLGFLEDLGLATITLNENLKIIQAFRPQDARAFLGRSGLPIEPDLLRKAVDQLAAVEQTEGLIRPITLNMLGLALSHRSPADVAELPNVEEILTDYCRSCISRPAIGPYAPAVLRPLISRVETIQPRTVAELARRTRLRPGVVRGVLLNLGNDGLVRRVDAKEDLWEVAHDFVAHLLAGLLRRFQTLKVGIPAAAAVALLVGLAIAFVPPAGPPPHIPPSPEPPPKPAPSPVFAILGPNDDPRAAIPWLWDNGATIKIHFLDGALPLREEVKRFASEWTAHANLTFEYVADRDAAAVRISLETNPGAFYSFLGAQARAAAPDQPTAVLGFTPDLSESERRRRTLFVFGHILGLISEHTNPNCQGVLRFKKPEVYDYYAKAYGWTKPVVEQFFGNVPPSLRAYRACDPYSIMMHQIPPEVIEPSPPGFYELSGGDKAFIQRLYPGRIGTRNPANRASGHASLVKINEKITGSVQVPGTEKLYSFVVETAGLYTIEADGEQAWILSLLDEQMELIQEDQVSSGPGQDARIERELSRGTYFLKIRNRIASAKGDFGLIVRPSAPAPTPVDAADIGLNPPIREFLVKELSQSLSIRVEPELGIGLPQRRGALRMEGYKLYCAATGTEFEELTQSIMAEVDHIVDQLLSNAPKP